MWRELLRAASRSLSGFVKIMSGVSQAEERQGRLAQVAGAAFIVVAVAGALYAINAYSNQIMICHETNNFLTDENYIDIMIGTIVREGDHGGRTYANRLDYLGDRTECCTIDRVTDKLPSGLRGKPEVSISAKYFNARLKDYIFIQRRFDACGHAASKPLIAG